SHAWRRSRRNLNQANTLLARPGRLGGCYFFPGKACVEAVAEGFRTRVRFPPPPLRRTTSPARNPNKSRHLSGPLLKCPYIRTTHLNTSMTHLDTRSVSVAPALLCSPRIGRQDLRLQGPQGGRELAVTPHEIGCHPGVLRRQRIHCDAVTHTHGL